MSSVGTRKAEASAFQSSTCCAEPRRNACSAAGDKTHRRTNKSKGNMVRTAAADGEQRQRASKATASQLPRPFVSTAALRRRGTGAATQEDVADQHIKELPQSNTNIYIHSSTHVHSSTTFTFNHDTVVRNIFTLHAFYAARFVRCTLCTLLACYAARFSTLHATDAGRHNVD